MKEAAMNDTDLEQMFAVLDEESAIGDPRKRIALKNAKRLLETLYARILSMETSSDAFNLKLDVKKGKL